MMFLTGTSRSDRHLRYDSNELGRSRVTRDGTATDLAATAPDTAAGARSCAASGGGGTRENADESGPLGDAGSLSQFAVTFSCSVQGCMQM